MKKPWIILLVVVAVAAGIFVWVYYPRPLDNFAKCLKDNDVVLYGAFWCSHCQSQKALFGGSQKYLPYVECSDPDGKAIQACIDKNINSYPTWQFKDGTTLTGEQTLQTLSQRSGCPI